MRVKLNQQLMGIDGVTPIQDEGKPALTLKDVCVNAILTPIQEDDEKIKFGKWEIFKKLRDATEEVTLTAEEITLIKKCIGKGYSPLILGQSFEMLEK